MESELLCYEGKIPHRAVLWASISVSMIIFF